MKYSVVIPLYNHEKYIEEAVLSALNQSLPPAEIIIIDDGSKDRSLEICYELASKHALIYVVSQENKGAHNAINAGLALARFDFVAILNSDDVYPLNRFEILFEHSIETWDLIGSEVQLIDANSKSLGDSKWLKNAEMAQRILGNNIFSLAYANYFMSTSNFLFRKSLLSEIGYFSDYRYCHDLDFLIRVSRAKKILFVPQRLLKYRFHTNNTVKEGVDRVLNEAWKVILTNCMHQRLFFRFKLIFLFLISTLNAQTSYYLLNYRTIVRKKGAR